jgi:uncharacterized protein (DUF927 family)
VSSCLPFFCRGVPALVFCTKAFLNQEPQQIIGQTEAFLNAYGLSRITPLPYDPQSLPMRDLAGYRESP